MNSNSLEDVFKLRRKDGLSDKDIVREIFEETFDADVNEICRITGMNKLDVGRVKGWVARKRAGKKKLKRKTESEIEEEMETAEEESESIYKTDPDVNKILRKTIKTHPDIQEKHIIEVMSWAEMTPGGLHPTHLAALLTSMKGIDSRTANLLAQKYSLAVARAQQEEGPPAWLLQPPMQPMQMQQQTPFYPQSFPQPDPYQRFSGPTKQPTQGLYRVQDVERILRDREFDDEIEKIKDRVKETRDSIPRLIKESLRKLSQY